MKRLAYSSFLLFAVVFLSGCSFSPFSKNEKETSENPKSQSFSAKEMAGSLWRTGDGGHNFEPKSRIDEKKYISNADILSIAYHPKKQSMIYVSSVESGIFKTTDGGERWEPIAFPPKRIYSFILDGNDPDNRMFASGVVNGWGKIFKTSNGGTDWEEAYTEPGKDTTVTAMSQHPRDISIIMAGTSTGTVVKSNDAGNTWKNTGNKIEGTVADISFDAKNSLATYLLSYNKKIYYSGNGGEAWMDWEEEKKKEVEAIREKASEASKKGNRSLAEKLRNQADDLSERNRDNKMPSGIVSLAPDPSISGTIYAGTNKGLFVSRDFGKYWYEINIIESAEEFPIRSIAINPKNSKEVVFVAGRAFYKSLNGGETWEITGLNVGRDASFISYDPFDSNFIFIGLRKF